MRRAVLAGGVAALLSGCMHMSARGEPDAKGASAMLVAADGSERGRATITLVNGAMRLSVTGVGLTQGEHGLHIHTVGACDAPDFKTAGAHWNPAMKMHGRDNPLGAHSGDLPNLTIGSDGRGTVSADVPGAMAALIDADGASIVVHAAADDYRTDPSGNSGERIACGVFAAG